MNMFTELHTAFNATLHKLYSLTPEQMDHIDLNINDDEKKQTFGDITTNAALIIAKLVGANPRAVAQAIIEHFSHESVDHCEIAGPGFINLFLTKTAIKNIAHTIFNNPENYFKLDADDAQLFYNVEFVSGNPTGPLHIGHGRNGILGDTLSNILRFLGHHVTKEYYINDAGAQIDKLGYCFKIRCMQQLGLAAEIPEGGYQGEYLIELAHKALLEDRKAIETHLETNNLDFFATYAKDILLEEIKKTLTKYGIQFDVWFSEKTLHIDGAVESALKLLETRGYAYVSEDALWLKSTVFGDDKDRVLKRSNGEATYAAADVAYMQSKFARGAQKIIMVLGQDHHSYLQRMKAVAQALGHSAEQLDVILYQLVTLNESGEALRMSKRAGRIVSLQDVIDAVGTDVARFFYLNRKADAHLTFDIDLALKRTEENPVYYIQYAYVRINSIIKKTEDLDGLKNVTAIDIDQLDEQEKVLLKKICNLKTLLKNMSHNYQVHLLTYYALELAHLFHSYYGSHKVIDLENIAISRHRLALMSMLQKTLKLCMNLLGLSCPESM